MPLEMLGKYERLDVLGHGASGIVYLAKDTFLGKQVALKEISAQGEEKLRFLEEARVLDRLRHPNIVLVNSVDEIGGRIVIDMEYVRGRTLQDILRQTPQLPLPDALSIAAQLCDGLAYAHSQRTVHRDIKPANILLTDDGIVKLVDFGLAEVLGTHSFAGGAGTYAYMAPEDFHPEEQSDRQSDIWAAGVILYEMLAGRRPFQVAKSKDPFAWKMAVETAAFPPLSEFRADVSSALAAIVDRALARDKGERYREASSMAADLRGLGVLPPGTGKIPDTESAGLRNSQSASGTEEQSTPAALPMPNILPGFAEALADIDAFLTQAPDQWEAARAVLLDGTLAGWLRGLGEKPLAEVAEEVTTETDRDDNDKLRDFLYRAGLETANEAKKAHAEGQRLAKQGRFTDALLFLQRAVHLDPSRPEHAQDLAAALRATGDAAGAIVVLEAALAHHPAQRTLTRQHAALAGAPVTLSSEAVNFGILRRGQNRSCRLTLHNSGEGVLEGRVVSAPGWVRVEPSAFSTRRRQGLTLTAVTDGVWSTPASYQETVVLETSGGRHEISVSAGILPARLGWSRIALWYLPLLFCAALPADVGLLARFHAVAGLRPAVWQPGLAASLLLFLSAFVLSLAADVAWLPRLLPVGLAGLSAWYLVRHFGLFQAAGAATHLALLQTTTPVLVLLILQTCTFLLDASGWGNWKLWRWIVPLVGLLAAYSLVHLG